MTSTWQRLAGRTGGTIASLATATTAEGVTEVFAATAIGLHRSTDAGRTWLPASVGSIAPFVEVVVPSPNFARDKTIFVGTRTGLYRSLDAGESWQLVLVGSRMLAIALAPQYAKENILFVGTETDGSLRSGDAGRTWGSANPGLLDLTVMAVGLSPDFESDQTGFIATASGLYRTRNAGKSWRAVETGLEDPAIQCLGVSPAFTSDRLVFAGCEAEGLLRSEDAGATWEVVDDLADQGVTAVVFSPTFAENQVIAAATVSGVAISRDAGQTWQVTGADLGPVLTLAFVPTAEGEVLLAGLPRLGIVRSTDLGAAWQTANDGLAANLLVGVTPSPNFAKDKTLFGAGLEDGVTVSRDAGATWEALGNLGETTIFGVVAAGAPGKPILYAATAHGVVRSADQGKTWVGIGPAEVPITVGSLAVSPAAVGDLPLVLAACPGGRLLATEDDGASWRPLGQAFGGADIVSVAISSGYTTDKTIFVGTCKNQPDGSPADLVVWRSTDGGKLWERWLVERGQNVLPLVLSPTYPADKALFVGIGAQVMRPRRNIEEIRAGSRRPLWQGVTLNDDRLPAVTALAVSPNFQLDNTLFAATSDGVFISKNAGETFAAWSEDLEPRSVVALAVSPGFAKDKTVFAISLGGSVWRRVG